MPTRLPPAENEQVRDLKRRLAEAEAIIAALAANRPGELATPHEPHQEEAAELRRRTEERLREQEASSDRPQADQDLRRLVHEPEVHQIDLEMQNEERRRAQCELEVTIADRTASLRRSEAKYRALVEQIPAVVYTAALDAANVTTYINPQIERLIGYPPAEFVTDPNIWHKLLHADDCERVVAQVARSCAGGEPFVLEYRVIARNGRMVWFRDEAVIIRDEAGRPVCLQGVMTDITEQKRAEETLREAKDYTDNIIGSMAEMLVVVSPEGRITTANRAACRLLGYAEHELIGQPATLLFEEEEEEEEDSQLIMSQQALPVKRTVLNRLVREGSVSNIEKSLLTKSGGTIPVLLSGAVMRGSEGRIAGIVCLALDITERKRAEQALRESEKRFRLAMEAADEGLWDRHIPTNEVYRSRHCYVMLGYEPGEIPESFDGWITFVHPDDRETAISEVDAILQPGFDIYESEYRFRAKDGQWRWIQSRGRVVERDADGRAVRTMGTHVDITDRKQTEVQARQREAELAHVSRLNVMGELASGLAHELNQPLTTILTGTELLQRMIQSETTDPGELADTLKEIGGEAERAGRIIHRLRKLVSKREVQRSTVDVNDIVREAVELVTPDARDHQVTLQLNLVEPMPLAQADPVQLEQVVLNLLRNAIEAMDGPEIDQRRVTIRTHVRNGDTIEVAVQDAGKGVPPDDIGRIFDPFFTTKPEGMGIGLAISRSIIEAHGGRVWAEPNPDRGMTFRFTLPSRQEVYHDGVRTDRVCGG